jgi:hypothetical protein
MKFAEEDSEPETSAKSDFASSEPKGGRMTCVRRLRLARYSCGPISDRIDLQYAASAHRKIRGGVASLLDLHPGPGLGDVEALLDARGRVRGVHHRVGASRLKIVRRS